MVTPDKFNLKIYKFLKVRITNTKQFFKEQLLAKMQTDYSSYTGNWEFRILKKYKLRN